MHHIRYIFIEIVKYTAFIIGIHALMYETDMLLGFLLLGIGILATIRSFKLEPPHFIACLDKLTILQKTLIQSAFVIGYGVILLGIIHAQSKAIIIGVVLMFGSIVLYKFLTRAIF